MSRRISRSPQTDPGMPLAQACRELKRRVAAPVAESVPLAAALGRVLACDLRAPSDLPREARSRMDGYALAAPPAGQPVPFRYRLRTETAAAGVVLKTPLQPGEAVRILTGAPLPTEADRVVADEDAHVQAGVLTVAGSPEAGAWVQAAAAEVRCGEPIARAGSLLTPALLALAAACGWPRIKVFRRPRIAVLGTGDELREPGEPLSGPWNYCNSRCLVQWLAATCGGEVLNLGLVGDDPAALAARLQQLEAEAVITTGGTGCGDRDVLAAAWELLGITTVFRGIGLRPGHQTSFGTRAGTGYLALPGNPWAAEAVFLELAEPWLWALAGAPTRLPARLPARLGSAVGNDRAGAVLVSGQLEGGASGFTFRPLPADDSLFAQVRARGAYLLIPPQTRLETGGPVAVGLYDRPLPPALTAFGSGLNFALEKNPC